MKFFNLPKGEYFGENHRLFPKHKENLGQQKEYREKSQELRVNDESLKS